MPTSTRADLSQPHILVPAIGFAVMAVLFALHDVAIWSMLGRDFTPFSVAYPVSAQTYDETHLYVPGARRFFERGSILPEVDVYELRDLRSGYPVLHSIVIGGLARLLGSLEAAWVIGHGIFPASVWLLLFLSGRRLLRNDASALLLSLLVGLVAFGPRNFLLLGAASLVQPLELARMPHPALSFAVLLAAVMTVARALDTRTISSGVLAGICVGANFYSYYFYWVALGLGLGVWSVASLVLRRSSDTKLFAIIGGTALLIGLPYLATVWGLRHSPDHINLMGRVGGFGRDIAPVTLALSLLAAGLAVWAWQRCQPRPLLIALVFALVGAGLGLHFQLITGYYAQHGHFFNRAVNPLGLFLVGAIVIPRLQSWRTWQYLCVAGCAGLVLLGGYRQIRVAGAMAASHDRRSAEVQLIEQLRARLPAGSVVASADPQVFTLLPALSTLWTFVPVFDRSQAANDEILQRYLLTRKLEGATIADVHRDFEAEHPTTKNDRKLSYVLVGQNEYWPWLRTRIEQLWAGLDVGTALATRRIDILATRTAVAALVPAAGWRLQPLDPVGGWRLYSITRAQP